MTFGELLRELQELESDDDHVLRLGRIMRKPLVDAPVSDEVARLAEVIRTEHAELARYTVLVHLAQALGAGDDVVHSLRLSMGEEEYELEQAEHALVQLLAEKITNR
jgi:ferritin-like metal-binding protein YciE